MKEKDIEKLKWFENVFCRYFDLKPMDLMVRTRKRNIVDCRFCVMVYMHKTTQLTTGKITDIYNLTHAMIYRADKVFNNLFETDKKFKEFIFNLEFAYNQKFLSKSHKYTGKNYYAFKLFRDPTRSGEDVGRLLVCH